LKTIALSVPYGTDLATLAPTYTLSTGGCDQPNDGVTPPSPTFAAAPGNTVTYTAFDETTTPPTTNAYAVTATVAPPFTMALTGDGTTGTLMENGEADGYRFTVGGSDLTVNWLGLYDAPNGEAGTVGDGLLAGHRVSIWLESDETLVAQTTVLTTDGLEGNFRGNNITPVTLTANTGYVIAADYDGAGDRQREGDDLSGWEVYSGISGLAGRYGGAGGGMPTDGWSVMIGPNFGVTASSLTPPELSGYGPWSSGTFPLTFSGPSGQSYEVLSSTNVALPLASWSVLSSGTFGVGGPTSTNYMDTSATNGTQFYRIKSP
jgi:hypothetical protein